MGAAAIAQESSPASRSFEEIKKTCEELGRTNPGDTQTMASLLSEMTLNYYKDVLKQAQQSFYCALAIAAVGTVFFICAAGFAMKTATLEVAKLSAVAGVLTQLISAINFYLYNKAARQFASFHICLERTNRFMLTNSICENLNEKREEMRAELIRVMANAPMLTLDGAA